MLLKAAAAGEARERRGGLMEGGKVKRRWVGSFRVGRFL
jgi:hypothetical protein